MHARHTLYPSNASRHPSIGNSIGKHAELAKQCPSVPKAEAVNSCWQPLLCIDGLWRVCMTVRKSTDHCFQMGGGNTETENSRLTQTHHVSKSITHDQQGRPFSTRPKWLLMESWMLNSSSQLLKTFLGVRPLSPSNTKFWKYHLVLKGICGET